MSNDLIHVPDGMDDIAQDPAAGAEERVRRTRKLAYIGLGLFVVILLLAATIIQVGGAVVGSGQLGVESRVKQISHPQGGVIDAIFVRDGQKVRKGALLMRLDNDVSGLNANLSSQTVEQLLAQRARLMAEREGLSSVRFPPELTMSADTAARQAILSEQRLFALRQSERAGLRSQLQQRIRQLDEQIAGYRVQIAALNQQKALIAPERQGVKELWDKRLVTINRLNQLERTAVDLDGSIGSLEANIAQTRARISETREQLISVDQNARSTAGTELFQVITALNEQQVKSASASDQFTRSEIRAPYAGTIDKLAFATVGGVIQPAQTIMEIVPDNERLLVEAAINPTDIDRVRGGQAARVRLSAFNMTTTPEIDGTVVFVSPERVTNPDSGISYYRVHVRMDERQIGREGLALKPGMPAEVFITTGSRSMLSYILKPLRDQFARAFKD